MSEKKDDSREDVEVQPKAEKKRCPYGCLYDPREDPYHIAACREANRP